MTITLEKLAKLAYEAGFENPESQVGLSGNSEFDEEICVEEYPCGDAVLKLAELLGVTVETEK